MRRLALVLLTILFLLPNISFAETFTGKIVSVHDGDTITVLDITKHQRKIRLAEIDAPELNQPYGYKSKQMLSTLVFGKVVTIKVQAIDKYSRTVGRVYQDGNDINLAMVKQGGAWVYRQYLKDKNLLAAEDSARVAGSGFWVLQDDQRIPPWEWRKMKRENRKK